MSNLLWLFSCCRLDSSLEAGAETLKICPCQCVTLIATGGKLKNSLPSTIFFILVVLVTSHMN